MRNGMRRSPNIFARCACPMTSIFSFSSRAFTFAPTGSRSNVKDRKSTRLNSSHLVISYAVFCLKKKNDNQTVIPHYNPRLLFIALDVIVILVNIDSHDTALNYLSLLRTLLAVYDVMIPVLLDAV